MWNNNITLHWSVPLEIWGKELLSLTWSAINLEMWWNNVLVDLWMFQWWEGSDLFNKKNIDFLKDIDCAIISHPHIDHVWRLPLLYKYGFRKPIYMTSAARQITRLMLEDSFKIQEGDKLERLSRNNKLWSRLREALKIEQSLIALQKNNFADKNLKTATELYIQRKLGKSYDKEDVLKQLSDYLGFYWVAQETDIKRVVAELNETLFTLEEMEWVLSLIQPLEYSEEKIISSKKVNVKNNNSENQELLENLPERIASWFKWDISVDTKSEKRKLRDIWEKSLKEKIKNVFGSNPDLKIQRNKLKKDLETAYSYCNEKFAFFNDKKNQNSIYLKNDPEYRGTKKQLEKYGKKLEKYWIERREDIDRLIEDNEKIIDLYKINIPFGNDDIVKASHLLQVKNTSNWLRKVTWFTLTDAAHVVGSASINMVSWEVKWMVKDLLDINWNATAVCLSGDLWRIKNNRLWEPELPAFPVNYLQIESTYWWREHRDRTESVNDLINSINSSKSHVLISSFAQHRLQEILMTLLEQKKLNKDLFANSEIVVDAPLGAKLTNLYIDYKWETFNLLDPEIQEKVFWEEVFRFLAQDEWQELYDLSLSGNLSEKEKEEQKNKKYIILASSGMMEWWAIMNHLWELLENPDATILAPGYLCNWTIWHQIVREWKKSVTIAGTKYDIECNKKFIDGFSSHISHNEILNYISSVIENWKLKLNSTISLNHWNIEWQEILKKDIESLLAIYDRKDIKVAIPKMFDSYSIERRRVTKRNKDVEIFTVLEWDKKWAVPSFLLWDVDLDNEIIDKESAEDNELEEQRNTNQDLIEKFKEKCLIIIWKISKSKKSMIEEYLKDVFKNIKSKKFFSNLSKISKLSTWQSKTLENIIDKKLARNKALKDTISSQKNKIKNIDIIYELIEEFKHNIDSKYLEDIEEHTYEIFSLNREILALEEEDRLLNEQELVPLSENDEQHKSFYKLIQSKKRRITYLKSKIKDLEYMVSWNTDSLKQQITQLTERNWRLKIKIKKIKERVWVITKENKHELDPLSYKIVANKKKIREIELKIRGIEWKRINFETRLKSNIPYDFHDKLSGIFEKLWEWNDKKAIYELRELCDDSILDLKSEIAINAWDLTPHISINLESRKPHFGWRNLYEELSNWDWANIDFDMLNNLLNSNFFSDSDKQYIEEQLDEIEKVWKFSIKNLTKKMRRFLVQIEDQKNENKKPEEKIDIQWKLFDIQTWKLDIDKLTELVNTNFFSEDDKKNIELQLIEINKSILNRKTWKRELVSPMKKLGKFFRAKQEYNKDLWINLDISIKEMNDEALKILSDIFDKEYFEEIIFPNFNIYLFLKSKESFIDYVSKKYNPEKLKWFSEAFATYEKFEQEVEYSQVDLEKISALNSDASTKEDLVELNFWIDALVKVIKRKISDINQIV